MKLKAVFRGLIAFVLLVWVSQISTRAADVTLLWDLSSDEGTGMVKGYSIWYGISGGSSTNSINAGLTNRATVAGLSGGQTYFFYATAYDVDQIHGDPTAKITYTTPVSSPNNTPPALDAIPNQTVDEGATLQLTLNAVDSDSPAQTVRYSLGTNAPPGASVNTTSGVFTWTPTSAQAGTTFQITAIATDSGSPAMSDSYTFSVNVRAGVYLTVNSSPDGTVQLTPAGTSTPSGFRYAPGASVQLTAQPASGKTFDYWTVNGQTRTGNPLQISMSANTTITPFFITPPPPNTAPTLASIANRTVDEGSSVQFTMTASDADVPAQALRFSLANAPTGASVNPTNGVFFWQPSGPQIGTTNQITAIVTDNGSPTLSASRTFTITVRAGVYLTVNSSTNGTVQLNPVGTSTASGYRYVPGASVTLTAQPNSGQAFDRWTVNGQTQTANPLAITMSANTTVTPSFSAPNTAPTLAVIPNRTIDEGSSLQFTMSASDSDLPAQTLSFSLANAPAGATVNPTNGVFFWQPSASQVGTTNQITATVTDNGSPALSASQTFTVVARAGVYLTINQSSDGTVQLSPTGTSTPSGFRYIPGTSVTLTAQPNSGKRFDRWTVNGQTQMANPLTLTMVANTTVAPIFQTANTAPALEPISDRMVDEGSPLQITFAATDADTPTQTLRFSLTNAPSGASLNPTNGVFFWQPDSSYAGTTNEITAIVTDDGTPAMSSSQTFSVMVRAGVYVILSPSSDGTVQVNPNGTSTSSGLRYAPGTRVQFTAQANLGKRFDHWVVNGAKATANPLALDLATNTTVSSVFKSAILNWPPIWARKTSSTGSGGGGDSSQLTAKTENSDTPVQSSELAAATETLVVSSINPTNVFLASSAPVEAVKSKQTSPDGSSSALNVSRTNSVTGTQATNLLATRNISVTSSFTMTDPHAETNAAATIAQPMEGANLNLPLRIVNARGSFFLAFPSSAGKRYRVYEATDPRGMQWTSSELTAESDITEILIDPSGPPVKIFMVKGL